MSRESRTVVFADVSGSTRLFEGRGDEAARKTIQHTLHCCANIVVSHEGEVVKTIGDEVLATFPEVEQALCAAIEMQRWANEDRQMCDCDLGLRIGLHHGAVIAEESDVFGSTVNTASRMVDLAGRGQIVMTHSSSDSLPAPLQERCRELGAAHIPGRDETLDIVSVAWEQDTANLTAMPRGQPAARATSRRRLLLNSRAGPVALPEHSPPFTLGRDPACSLVVDSDWVSRHHARIEYRHGFFVLVDQSTNGTWLTLDGQPPVHLHRGELPLLRDGTLTLGQQDGEQAAVQFRLEEG
ncbi:MAG: adenylate/guanylate cyclase domain-containing protein [Haliea sp.]|nr:adenylate/guanylate cyclase domain-containing protein [Haliea sp.]|tara:strand:+ start:15836 stop:16726 length:891 start_codon:yes stop_codon:yes gene_type:complete